MPYAANDGVRIHYHLDGNDAGPPLVLMHGFSMSLHDWAESGYVEALGGAHRLILVDGRGHGRSDKPHDPAAYRVALQATDVVAVLDDLGIARAHFLGFSMGGMIGFALGIQAPERCASLVLVGDDGAERDEDDPFSRAIMDSLRGGIDAWAEGWGWLGFPGLVERQRRNDLRALLAYRTIVEHRGFAEALPDLSVPSLLLAGTGDGYHDGARAAAASMPRARFVSLPGLDHLGSFYRTDLAVPHIAAFLAEVDARESSA